MSSFLLSHTLIRARSADTVALPSPYTSRQPEFGAEAAAGEIGIVPTASPTMSILAILYAFDTIACPLDDRLIAESSAKST
ncbi:hypothetical protein DP939_43145 [Spongiactinospora rosea]|uniref:Uncharacterized protein n=1 Tax=Spongiactinospora rosea TaxID=2248750 RepID=A0A366LKM0_9ACTN|nr:hypothetical protein DP939_43145 [Spongiactinospora rosea]